MYHPSVSDGHDDGPKSKTLKKTTKKAMLVITEAEKKTRVINIVTALGFDIDADRWDEKGWIRFSHPISEASDFCVMWYNGMYDLDNLHKIGETLLKLGEYKKIQELKSILCLD